jgi:hypothetical protein
MDWCQASEPLQAFATTSSATMLDQRAEFSFSGGP